MAKLDTLKLYCSTLDIIEGKDVFPTKTRVDKEGETYEPWQYEYDKDGNVITKPGRHLEFSISDYEKAIQKHFIEKYRAEGTLSPFLEIVLNMESPMLALQIKNLKPEVQELVKQDNSNYIYEEKLDGCRCLLCYDENFGFDFYSRGKNEAVDGDYLPISYRTKLLLPKLATEVFSTFNIHSFIIDCELLPQFKEIRPQADGTEVVADTQLSLVANCILGTLDDLSHKIQETNPIKFTAFDIIKLNNIWFDESHYISQTEFMSDEDRQGVHERLELKNRKLILDKIIKCLKLAGMGNYIDSPRSTMTKKDEFYDKILAEGGEGVVAKDLHSLYDSTSRRRGEWVKLKRSVAQAMKASSNSENVSDLAGDTFDAFVIGFVKGNDGTSLENLVGALNFGTYLLDNSGNLILDEDGNPKVHFIASISGLSLKLREMITEIVDGEVRLKSNFYNMVAEIDGQDISSKNLRFSHARLLSWRPDRSSDTCKIKKSFIESLVL